MIEKPGHYAVTEQAGKVCRAPRLVIFAAVLLGVPCAHAQAGCSSPERRGRERFVDCARQGTAAYRDLNAAIRDGYRPIGGDFPAMGEHWIHVGRVFDGELDPARPEVLSYVRVGGNPVLLGAAYAVPLLADEAPPDWPAGREAWHDHYRGLDEETFLPEHHISGAGRSGPRIAMLHAWIWAPNPDGMFAADNWAVPYLRLGFEVPEAPVSASRALSLASGGQDYFLRVIERVGGESAGIREAFGAAAVEVRALLMRPTGGSAPGPARLEQLSRVWETLWESALGLLDAEARAELEHLGMR
jgi:hypothetical protein